MINTAVIRTATKNPFTSQTIRQILAAGPGHRVTVNGWVTSRRKSKNIQFLHVSDGPQFSSSLIQCCIPSDISSASISVGSSISASGIVVESQGSQQPIELQVDEIFVDGGMPVDPPCPVSIKKRHSLEHSREWAHLRGRQAIFQSIARIRNSLMMASHGFFQKHDFTHIHTPLITANDCEGAGEVFTLSSLADPEFFSHRNVYLTVSSQLHLEMALGGFKRVYTLSPCFRADIGSQESVRHLAEFYMLEAEWAWPQGGVFELMDAAEALVSSTVQSVSNECAGDIEYLQAEVPHLTAMQRHRSLYSSSQSLHERVDSLIGGEFERISYSEAINILLKHSEQGKVKFKRRISEWGPQLQSEHERYLCQVVGDNKKPVFVYRYPRKSKPFYMLAQELQAADDGYETVECFDLLLPGLGELVGGSMREHRLQELKTNIMKQELQQPADMDWYIDDLRKYGSSPHGGFGLGFDRLLMHLTGMNNIRDVVQAGRWRGTCRY